MSFPFLQVPANFRTFSIFVETDNSKANRAPAGQLETALIIAPQLLTIHAEGTVVPVASGAEADASFGVGSIAAQMCRAFLEQTNTVPLYCAPLDDEGAGTAAAGEFVFSGTATESREMALYVHGIRIAVAVVTGDDAAAVETKAVAAATEAYLAPQLAAICTANGAGTGLVVTARNKGTFGNLIDLRHSHNAGERLPAGITVAITAMTGGATDPAITGALNGLGPNTRYHTIAHPYLDATNLTSLESNLDTRWNATDGRYGHAFTAVGSRANDASALTHAEILTLGNARNSAHSTIFSAHPSPTAPWVIAAQVAALDASYSDPAAPRRGQYLKSVVAPKELDQWTWTQRNQFFYDGIATSIVVAGRVTVERLVTTYQVNGSAIADPSYLDVETLRIAERINTDIPAWFGTRYANAKIADDGTRFPDGQVVLTPSITRSEMLSLSRFWFDLGILARLPIIDDGELLCERNVTDRARMDVAFSPSFMGQFRGMAVLNSFLLGN